MKEDQSGGPETAAQGGTGAAASDRSSAWPRRRLVGLGVALTAAIALFLTVVNAHYPVDEWLFWRYLRVILVAAAWVVSCASMGLFLLDKLGVRAAGLRGQREQNASSPCPPDLVFAFPLGVLAFQLAIFVLGLLGLLGTATFVLLPSAFTLAGLSRLQAVGRPLLRMATPVRSVTDLAIVLFGAGGIALLYFQILTPEPFSWDARWYHLPIAKHYALTGAIRPFPEGWFLGAWPQSASLTYTWAFLMPGVLFFDRLELCAHLEMAVFLCTIASIPSLVRELAPGASGRGAWVAMFLFPGIFLYDGNLHCGADHMAAVFCIPIALSLMRVWRSWNLKNAVLFAAFISAGILTKLSAWSMLVFPSLLFLARALGLGGARMFRTAPNRAKSLGAPTARAPVLPPLLAAGATVLVLTATFWLKNVIWYGDPLYPYLHNHLASHPWSPEASAQLRVFDTFYFPPKPGWEGVKEALANTITFSFAPNDWGAFHRDVPVFGSLFTLTLLFLPFVRASAPLWLGHVSVMVSMIAWYYTNHQDRYLQTWLPFMAAATMAALSLVWRERHLAVRALVVVLVSVQMIWGGDVPFFPTHNMVHDSPLRVTSNFLASGFLKTPHRLRPYGAEGELGEWLPDDAHILLHELNPEQLGVRVVAVTDQWQGRISYTTLQTPAAIYRELRDIGVTHLTWIGATATGWNSVGNDLTFLNFALNYTVGQRSFGKLVAARMPSATPPPGMNDRVIMATCRGAQYARGLYRVGRLAVPDPGKPWAAPDAPLGPDASAAAREAGFLVVEPRCAPELSDEVKALFHGPVERGNLQLYVRKAQ